MKHRNEALLTVESWQRLHEIQSVMPSPQMEKGAEEKTTEDEMSLEGRVDGLKEEKDALKKEIAKLA